jgi:hypothetical protein
MEYSTRHGSDFVGSPARVVSKEKRPPFIETNTRTQLSMCVLWTASIFTLSNFNIAKNDYMFVRNTKSIMTSNDVVALHLPRNYQKMGIS